MPKAIFKSDDARRRLEGWYDKFLAKVTVPFEHREVPTEHGPSHVLVAGEAGLPPLVCLHGSLASSAHMLSEVQRLTAHFRLILPDMPGQSPRGPQVRLSYKDDALPRWLLAVLDGLGVEQFDLFGISLGGFVARKTATVAPDRVRGLVLFVPAGVVTGSALRGLTRVFWPLMMYRLRPSEPRLRKLVGQLFTEWDDDWGNFMGDAFSGYNLDLRIPPVATDDELRGLTTPTLVLTADDDVSFPGGRLAERVKKLMPNVDAEVLANCKHCPPTTDEFRAWLAERVTKFLTRDGSTPTH